MNEYQVEVTDRSDKPHVLKVRAMTYSEAIYRFRVKLAKLLEIPINQIPGRYLRHDCEIKEIINLPK
jgi:hypothetical protein